MSGGTILGISPGTRTVGVAVIRDGKLLHAQVRTFHGAWSEEKLQKIMRHLEATMGHYMANQIVIKVPDVLPLSKSFHQVIGTLNVLCGQRDIRPLFFSLSDLTAVHCNTRIADREQLIAAMVKRHLELHVEYRRHLNNKSGYYYKVFEAVPAARMLN